MDNKQLLILAAFFSIFNGVAQAQNSGWGQTYSGSTYSGSNYRGNYAPMPPPPCNAGDLVRSLQDSLDFAVHGDLPRRVGGCVVNGANPLVAVRAENPLIEALGNDKVLDAALKNTSIPQLLRDAFKQQDKYVDDVYEKRHKEWQSCIDQRERERVQRAQQQPQPQHPQPQPQSQFSDQQMGPTNSQGFSSGVSEVEFYRDSNGNTVEHYGNDFPPPEIYCPPEPINYYSRDTSSPFWTEYLEVLNFSTPLQETYLQFLFQEPSGSSDGGRSSSYTVGEHSALVLKAYDEQASKYQITKIPLTDDHGKKAQITDVDRLMRYTLALHDIGKSIANRAGDKAYETFYSVPIARQVMHNVVLPDGTLFSDQEIAVAANLIAQHQLIGDYLRSWTKIEDAIKFVNDGAKKSKLNPCNYFLLLEMVFVADASSYESLRYSVFTPMPTTDGGIAQLAVSDNFIYSKLSDPFRKACPAGLNKTPTAPMPVYHSPMNGSHFDDSDWGTSNSTSQSGPKAQQQPQDQQKTGWEKFMDYFKN